MRIEGAMKFKEVAESYESLAKMANAIGMEVQTLYKWKAQNKIPIFKQCVFEIITEGRFKANREELMEEISLKRKGFIDNKIKRLSNLYKKGV